TASYWPSPSPAPNGSFAFTNPGPVSAFADPVLPMRGAAPFTVTHSAASRFAKVWESQGTVGTIPASGETRRYAVHSTAYGSRRSDLPRKVGSLLMRSTLLSKPALIMAVGVALAGLCITAGTAGAATRSGRLQHRGAAGGASRSTARQATGMA